MTPCVIFVFLITSRTSSVKSVLGSATRSMSHSLKRRISEVRRSKGVRLMVRSPREGMTKVRSPKEGMSKVRGPRRGLSKVRSPKAGRSKVSWPMRGKSKRRRAKVRRPRIGESK